MSASRDTILAPSLKIPARDVSWYFMADYYDRPISGLAIYQKRIFRFCRFEEDISRQSIYVLQELTAAELEEEVRVKRKFQQMVGTYGCFDEEGKLLPKFVGDDASRERFFSEESYDRTSKPSPFERPIIAWFDASEERAQPGGTDNSGAAPLRV